MSEMKSNGTAEKKTAGTSAKNKSAPQAQFRSGAVSGEYQKDRAGPERTAKRKTAGKAASSDYQRTADHSTAQEQFQSGTDAGRNGEKSAEESRKANEEFFRRYETEEEKGSGYSSGREEARERRKRSRHRQYQGREKSQRDFRQSDGDFAGRSDFMKDAGAETTRTTETSHSRRLDRLEKKAEKAAKKTKKAMKKLPHQKEYKLVRRFDETTGQVTYKLETRKVPKKPRRRNPVYAAGERIAMEGNSYIHQKISEHEKENSGVEAAHKTERTVENAAWKAVRHRPDRNRRIRKRVATLEKKQFKAETKFGYEKFLEENPEIKKKAFRKRMQKLRIRREYAKAAKKGAEAKQAAGYAKKAAQSATSAARKLQEFAAKHIGAIVTVGFFALFFMVIAAGVSSCSMMLSGGVSNIMAGSYQSVPAQLDASDEAMTAREMALQNTIDSIETDHPDYDEYSYNLGEIGHNPFTLANYLSALYGEVEASAVDGDIESLFGEMYELTLTPREETRTRTVMRTGTRTVTDPETGEETEEEYEYEEEEEYTVKILDVELAVTPLEDIVAQRLAGNSDALGLYAVYQETYGALQQFYTPLDMDWYSMVSSYYGYRKNPVTGQNQFHRGLDIAVQEGTEVYAAQDGTVTTATYDAEYGNYIVIEDAEGYVTKYAHLQSLNVSAGQTVRHGALIGKTGNTGSSTGSHLHIECLYNGEYYNPLFYFENGNGSIYGTTDPIGYGSGDAAALIAEAEKYLGYPYVWGGSSPSTSFDCSGFVCYVLTNSGYCDIPRTTAQGIYNKCRPISASEAQPGDIIFFTGTYNSGNPVTHVGIYAGNGMMIHCGDPIKYSSINTPYWQSHFYGYGRIEPAE